jgi:hypothetical protein
MSNPIIKLMKGLAKISYELLQNPEEIKILSV